MTVGADGVQHAAVVGDQQQGAVVGLQRLLQLLNGGQVQVVGRFIQDQQVDPAGLQQRHPGAGALTG